jgi:PAS domain S-box-containing protein
MATSATGGAETRVDEDLMHGVTAADADAVYRRLVNSITDFAIYSLDANGLVTSWNTGAQRLKGYAAKEIVGHPFARFYTARDQAAGRPRENLDAALHGRLETEGWRVRKDGGTFWAQVVIDPIRSESGEVVGYAKITRDLTERRAHEESLAAAQEALAQARKLEAIGQLTGGIAHDFNNILMAILGSLELAQKRMTPTPRISPFLDNAMHAARRGAALTQRMLSFARRRELRREAVNLNESIPSLMGLIRGTFDPNVITQVRMADDLPAVLTDPAQLEASLLNLALNGCDAMPGGGVLTVEAEAISHPGDANLAEGRYVRIRISDTGEGMDAETLTRAVEPFFTTKGMGKGTGLGLSMAHGLAVQSGGRLALTSQKGRGTFADMWLPVETAPSEQPDDPREDAGSPAKLDRLVVLAVDDDPLVLFNTVAMLQEQGHVVFSAKSGEEALAVLDGAGRMDLVVSDHAMPNMTGLQLAQALRVRRPELPVILISGYAKLPDGADSRLLKVSKPFGQLELARAVAEIMHAARQR